LRSVERARFIGTAELVSHIVYINKRSTNLRLLSYLRLQPVVYNRIGEGPN